jgi:hypothetical protein
MNHRAIIFLKFFFAVVITVMIHFSCKQSKGNEPPRRKHMAEIGLRGTGMLYLDIVPNETVMKMTDTSGGTEFFSFLIGFVDSIANPGGSDPEKGKHFQYEMYKNWKALSGNDSISPVFFQPKIKLNQQVDEGILVFEMPKGEQPDILVYNDSYGPWGVQRITIKR